MPRQVPRGADPTGWLAAHVARQPEGNRDNALFWAACRAIEAGARELDPLVDAALETGLPERQARRTIRSAQETIARGLVLPAPCPQPSSLPPRTQPRRAKPPFSSEPSIRSPL